jgi:hypothetical protein
MKMKSRKKIGFQHDIKTEIVKSPRLGRGRRKER